MLTLKRGGEASQQSFEDECGGRGAGRGRGEGVGWGVFGTVSDGGTGGGGHGQGAGAQVVRVDLGHPHDAPALDEHCIPREPTHRPSGRQAAAQIPPAARAHRFTPVTYIIGPPQNRPARTPVRVFAPPHRYSSQLPALKLQDCKYRSAAPGSHRSCFAPPIRSALCLFYFSASWPDAHVQPGSRVGCSVAHAGRGRRRLTGARAELVLEHDAGGRQDEGGVRQQPTARAPAACEACRICRRPRPEQTLTRDPEILRCASPLAN